MTTDLQRMHQDEWLAALRSADEQGFGMSAVLNEPFCALGLACNIGGYSDWWFGAAEWLCVSLPMLDAIYETNDAKGFGDAANLGLYKQPGRDLPEIADWFKAERDAHDGDLSEWSAS